MVKVSYLVETIEKEVKKYLKLTKYPTGKDTLEVSVVILQKCLQGFVLLVTTGNLQFLK